jgi:hypothetical protein
MSTKEEVATFLKDFKEKMKFWEVLFRDERGKNTQALVDLELRPIERKVILERLTVQEYSEGPIAEKLYGGSAMWVFGKTIKKKEVYINTEETNNIVQYQFHFIVLFICSFGINQSKIIK